MEVEELKEIAKLIRYWILLSTTEAGSGHPTSCLSAVELVVALVFGGRFRFDLQKINHPNNDRLIFSKGHAAPLLYSLFAAAGCLAESSLTTLRKFGSVLEGHPTPGFPYAEVATGSLGQGLSVGLGMALNGKYLDKLPYTTYVLLGDSEMAEGSCWEAIEVAEHYKLDNLVGIIDVNRLGQTGQTLFGHDITAYQKRISAFGWHTCLVNDGNDIEEVLQALQRVGAARGAPTMLIAKTIKGRGVSFLEDKEAKHGKALSREEFAKAREELGEIDFQIRGRVAKPKNFLPTASKIEPKKSLKDLLDYKKGEELSTRKAYGMALARAAKENAQIVALDAEVKNSTFASIFEEYFPERFFEMFVAEQNMAGAALGLSCRQKIPFVSTFSAFWTRAADQIRMAQYSRDKANIKFVGSHAGVSVGQDGASQVGLEDIALFRAIQGSSVLYPSDAVACDKLVRAMADYPGICYLRTTRMDTPILYPWSEEFIIGGSKVLRQSNSDKATIVAAGVTVHQALRAEQILEEQGISIRVIDCYSIKPLDRETLLRAARETGKILVVEDHYREGGIAEAVQSELAGTGAMVYSLAVEKIPVCGTPDELLDFEKISFKYIIKAVKQCLYPA